MAQDFWNAAERMNPTVKAIWLKALRSGDYTQGRGALAYQRAKDGQWCFCPIGVLTEEARKAGVDMSVNDFRTPINAAPEECLPEPATHVRGYDWITTGLIQSVARWAGLPEAFADIFLFGMLPQARERGQQVTIVRMNDEEKQTFAQIADMIEFVL